MSKADKKKVEALLWSYGITPNCLGFTYLAEILLLAEGGAPIDRHIIAQVAETHGRTRSSVYQAVKYALLPLHCLRFDSDSRYVSAPSPRQQLYCDIHYLMQALH